jgi:ferrous iron transport protein A
MTVTDQTATDQNNASPKMRLGLAKRGYSGVIHHLDAAEVSSALPAHELESRLIELGFVEGARVEVLHEGIIGRDPIAVRVENVTIAVRRREAMAIVVV